MIEWHGPPMTESVALPATRRQIRELVDGTLEVRLHIEPTHKADFHRLFGQIDMPVAIAPLNLQSGTGAEGMGAACAAQFTGAPDPRSGPQLAKHLHEIGAFFNPKLWCAVHDLQIYSSQRHKAYLETLTECWARVLFGGTCQGDLVVHHCKPANAIAGGKRQPEAPQKSLHFWGARVCDAHHRWLHGAADRAVKEAITARAVQETAERIRGWIKSYLKLASLADITWEQFVACEGTFNVDWGSGRL